MPDKRDLNLEKYSISKHRYRELNNFCLQYYEYIKKRDELIEERQKLYEPYFGNEFKNTKVQDDKIVNITEESALEAFKISTRIEALNKKIQAIEMSVQEIAGDTFYEYLLKSITFGISYERLYPKPPCNVKEFQAMRRLFYYMLDKKK
ncbi:MAG: hypothetical protein FWC41_00095 [Firmicutes bacterium]|nr:hypothetical protein [Bacillota bacterium]